jgi:hypothetical protein
MKNILILLLCIVVLGLGAYLYLQGQPQAEPPAGESTATTEATSTSSVADEKETVIGQSVEGRDIVAYHFGEGEREILFVGGIHGGYSWNTALVAYELMDYLEANPTAVPENVKVTVIPSLNPDGQQKVVGTARRFARADVPATAETVAGRFNANTVDLNRNFDCDWQASATWQSRTVSGGNAAFSEPEAKAMRAYVAAHPPVAVIVWYSAAGGVYASNCHGGVLSETRTLMNAYSKGSGYPAHENFDFYATTGDMTNWLAKEGVPAVSVLLTNHTDTEWAKNEGGIKAVLEHYAE